MHLLGGLRCECYVYNYLQLTFDEHEQQFAPSDDIRIQLSRHNLNQQANNP